MTTGNPATKEALVASLEATRDAINTRGQAFVEGFLGLQALQGGVTAKQLVDVQLL